MNNKDKNTLRSILIFVLALSLFFNYILLDHINYVESKVEGQKAIKELICVYKINEEKTK